MGVLFFLPEQFCGHKSPRITCHCLRRKHGSVEKRNFYKTKVNIYRHPNQKFRETYNPPICQTRGIVFDF